MLLMLYGVFLTNGQHVMTAEGSDPEVHSEVKTHSMLL